MLADPQLYVGDGSDTCRCLVIGNLPLIQPFVLVVLKVAGRHLVGQALLLGDSFLNFRVVRTDEFDGRLFDPAVKASILPDEGNVVPEAFLVGIATHVNCRLDYACQFAIQASVSAPLDRSEGFGALTVPVY